MSGAQVFTDGPIVATFTMNNTDSPVVGKISRGGDSLWVCLGATIDGVRESARTFLRSRADLADDAKWLLDALAPVERE